MATQSTWRSGSQTSVPVSKWEANANPSGIRSAAAQQHTSTTKSPITASAAENGASATSNQRRVSATPYASALGSKQAFAPTESDARIQSDRMTFLLVGLIGNTVLATTRSGAKFVGVLSATSTAEGTGNSSLGVVLSCAQQIMPDGDSLGALKKTLIIKGEDLDGITAQEVGLDVPVSLGKGDRNINAAFGTDTEISGKSLAGDATGGRTLQKWTGGADTELLLDDSSSATAKDGKSGGWDQFAANEAKFGVKSNYDETMYTTKLDKSGADFQERQRKADQLAREIMNSTTTNSHIAEERSAEALPDGSNVVQSEEDKYGAVVRGTGAYLPPAARRAAAAAAAANANVSATARMNSSTAANGADGAASPPSDTPSIVTTAPASGANDQKAGQHQDAVVNFRQFVSQERERAEKKKAALAKKEKENTLTALKSWSDNFKLSFSGQADKTQTKPSPQPALSASPASVSKEQESEDKKADTVTSVVDRPKPSESTSTAAKLAHAKAVLATWTVPEIPSLESVKANKRPSIGGNAATPTATTAASATTVANPQSSSIMNLPHIPPYNKNRVRDPAAAAQLSSVVTPPAGDGKLAASSKPAFRMSAKASSFKPFNPNAATFTPGGSTLAPVRVSAEASASTPSPAPAPTPPHPFFGHRLVKKSAIKQANLREEFNLFKTGNISDAAQVDSAWGFSGKPYRALFNAIPPGEDGKNVALESQPPHMTPNSGPVPGMQGMPPQAMAMGAGQGPYQHQQHGPHLGAQGMGAPGNMAMGAGGQMFYMPYGGAAGGYRGQPMQGMGQPPYIGQPPYMGQMAFSPPMPQGGLPPGPSMYSPQMQNMMPAGVVPPNMVGGSGGGGRGPNNGKGALPPNMYYQAANAQPMPFMGGGAGGIPPSFHHPPSVPVGSAGPSPLIRSQQQHGHHPVPLNNLPPPPHAISTPPGPGSQCASSANVTPSITSANVTTAAPTPGSHTTSPPNGKA